MTPPKETLSQKRRRASYANQRRLHIWKRDHPNRSEMALSKAIKLAGFFVIDWEYEVQDGEWHGWFNCAVEFQGRFCFIDFTANPAAKRDKVVMDRKAEYCDKFNHPLFVIKVGSAVEMQAELEMQKIRWRREWKPKQKP